jgi:hypothetical protein
MFQYAFNFLPLLSIFLPFQSFSHFHSSYLIYNFWADIILTEQCIIILILYQINNSFILRLNRRQRSGQASFAEM